MSPDEVLMWHLTPSGHVIQVKCHNSTPLDHVRHKLTEIDGGTKISTFWKSLGTKIELLKL